jgi:hypothetical protein
MNGAQYVDLADELIDESLRTRLPATFDDAGHENHVARFLADALDRRGKRKRLANGTLIWNGETNKGEQWTVEVLSEII